MDLLTKTVSKIYGLDDNAMVEAQKRLDYLLKPKGSLGTLEMIAKQLSGITGKIKNDLSDKAIIVFCSDNGVYEENIASYPQEVSTLVAETMVTGLSGVAVLSKFAGSRLKVVDVGLKTDVKAAGIVNRKIRAITSNFTKGPAMTRDEAVKAIEIGIDETQVLIDTGVKLIGTGEVGIGNTTTTSAVLYSLTEANLDIIVGRGAGLSDEQLLHKKNIVKKGVEINKPDINDPIDILSKVGGFDIAGLVGVYLCAAANRVPVVIDGFISGIAAVIAARIKPETRLFMIPSHISDEPGGKLINEILGIEPMLFMHMRLGEGTGCALAFNIIEAATVMMNNMGTFGDIGM